jgi:hypothetical protein
MPEPEVELSHISMEETEVTSQPRWPRQDGGTKMATPTWRCQDGDAKMATSRWRFSLMSQAGCERVDGRRRSDSEQSARFAFSPRKQAALRAGLLTARLTVALWEMVTGGKPCRLAAARRVVATQFQPDR